jgi:hypothetical protein
MLQGVGTVRQVPMGWEVAHWAKETCFSDRLSAMLLPQPPEQDAPYSGHSIVNISTSSILGGFFYGKKQITQQHCDPDCLRSSDRYGGGNGSIPCHCPCTFCQDLL